MKASNYIALDNALSTLKLELLAYSECYDVKSSKQADSLFDAAGEMVSVLMDVLEDERPDEIPAHTNTTDLI